MDGNKLNVTEEWLQVITQLTLSYQRKVNQTVDITKVERKPEISRIKVVELIQLPANQLETKLENRMF